jgi:hypothetical protein
VDGRGYTHVLAAGKVARVDRGVPRSVSWPDDNGTPTQSALIDDLRIELVGDESFQLTTGAPPGCQ